MRRVVALEGCAHDARLHRLLACCRRVVLFVAVHESVELFEEVEPRIVELWLDPYRKDARAQGGYPDAAHADNVSFV